MLLSGPRISGDFCVGSFPAGRLGARRVEFHQESSKRASPLLAFLVFEGTLLTLVGPGKWLFSRVPHPTLPHGLTSPSRFPILLHPSVKQMTLKKKKKNIYIQLYICTYKRV